MSNISPCDMEVESIRECTHWWEIKKYSCTLPELGKKLKSEKFSAADDYLNWRLEHMRYATKSDEIYVSINLRPDCYADLRKCESVSGSVNVYLINSYIYSTDAPLRFTTYSFELSYEEQNRNRKVAEFSMNQIKELLGRHDALTIICKLTYRKKNETVAISSSNNSKAVRISESRLLSDMERCFAEDRFKDVTISVKGKEYRAHKNILATRSTVFDKMLSIDMLESKKNHIDITDVDHEPFEEMLYYIYTGKVKNLDESAFELLPVADKYDLNELRSMCEEVLLKEISTDNATRILILADTHRAEELKERALRFIKENYASCKEFNDTEFWKNLAAGNAKLLTEMMAEFCKMQKLD
ncbi:speckle-type POZ protein-like [Planococcus citri]|uniref:speckle-type POZ protein-like n=1 Tax=Planococcus citri TaxID=170843 RepID=UPI0031F99720